MTRETSELSHDIERELSSWIKGAKKVVILGVGNPLRKDDSVGGYIAKKLKKTLRSKTVDIIECETVPENYLGVIERLKPSHVLVVDAAGAGLEPGSFLLTELSEVRGLAISSHNIPLSVFGEYLRRTTCSKVALLAIQPESMEFGVGLTRKLKEAADEAARILLSVLIRFSLDST